MNVTFAGLPVKGYLQVYGYLNFVSKTHFLRFDWFSHAKKQSNVVTEMSCKIFAKSPLTLPVPCVSESCIEIKN